MVDSLNSRYYVSRSSKPVGGQPWAVVPFSAAPNGFESTITLNTRRNKMSVDVLLTAVVTCVHLKIEEYNDATRSVKTDAYSTVAGHMKLLYLISIMKLQALLNKIWACHKVMHLFFQFPVLV